MPPLRPAPGTRYFSVGGAGFIGSHFTDHPLADPAVAGVMLYDNFSSGREWHYAHHQGNPRLRPVMTGAGVSEMDFSFDFDGSVVLLRDR